MRASSQTHPNVRASRVMFRRWVTWGGCSLLTLTSGFVPACTRTTIKVADERGPVTEERRKRDPEAPLFRSEWQVRPDHIDGHLTWQYCERERWWTTKRVKTVKHEALKAPG